ncbi:MAG: hypothetical protein J6K42_03140 [Clostridia bacterium]|nr:hypothetical protein [Clostridia bacterium]
MKKVIVSLLIIVIVAAVGVSGWYLWDSLQKEKEKTGELEKKAIQMEKELKDRDNNIENNESYEKSDNQETMTKDEALKIAIDVYHNAYNKFADGAGIGRTIEKGKVNPDIASDERLKFEVSFNSDVKKYFNNDGIERIKAICYIYKENGIDTFVQSENQLDPFGNMMSTIFGATDQGERKLEIVANTNDCIVVKSNTYENYEGIQKEYSRYIIFVKEGENWLIANFN